MPISFGEGLEIVLRLVLPEHTVLDTTLAEDFRAFLRNETVKELAVFARIREYFHSLNANE